MVIGVDGRVALSDVRAHDLDGRFSDFCLERTQLEGQWDFDWPASLRFEGVLRMDSLGINAEPLQASTEFQEFKSTLDVNYQPGGGSLQG